MRTIKAAVADGKGNFSITNINIGTPACDEVLVEIKAAVLMNDVLSQTSSVE